MSQSLPLRCRCGAVRGVALDMSPTTVNRVICYCRDCQAFARFLERDDVVDAAGGTDICQMSPSQVRITEGAEHLACVHLREGGLFRWYTDCCRTPVGNMIGAKFPFIGLVATFLGDAEDAGTRDRVLGEPMARIWGIYARGGCPSNVSPKAPPGMLLRAGRLMLGWWALRKAFPSPFFDETTKAPRARPRVLTTAERAALSG